MSRTRVRWKRVATLSVIALLGAGRAGAGPAEPKSRTYVVQPGDTVWRIASGLAERGDPRPIVDLIVRQNGLRDAVIVPGQRLSLPAPGR
jgi:LysM repeat protein